MHFFLPAIRFLHFHFSFGILVPSLCYVVLLWEYQLDCDDTRPVLSLEKYFFPQWSFFLFLLKHSYWNESLTGILWAVFIKSICPCHFRGKCKQSAALNRSLSILFWQKTLLLICRRTLYHQRKFIPSGTRPFLRWFVLCGCVNGEYSEKVFAQNDSTDPQNASLTNLSEVSRSESNFFLYFPNFVQFSQSVPLDP